MIKALLVNNDSDTWDELVDCCIKAGFAVTTTGCRVVNALSGDDFDIVILSGGWWYDDEIRHLETYAGETELLRHTDTPVLGICLGMQLMQTAFSGEIRLLDAPQRDLQPILVEPEGQRILGWPAKVVVHKNHSMGALSVAPGFEVLAKSPGHVEIIRHVDRPLLGVQFHPEVGELQRAAEMIIQLVEAARGMTGQRQQRAESSATMQALLVAPRPALDGSWYERLLASSRVSSEMWAHLGPSAEQLSAALHDFENSHRRQLPDMSPDKELKRTVAQEKQDLETLLAELTKTEADSRVRQAYSERIKELKCNAELYDAAVRRDARAFDEANNTLYGQPNPAIAAAVADAIVQLADGRLDDAFLPSLRQHRADVTISPDAETFQRLRQVHFDADGYYGRLFQGLPLPTGVVTQAEGDPLVRQLLKNIGADEYTIVDSTDGYWNVRAGVMAVARPADYALTAEEFIGVVGHEIGSHLLERLNGERQPLRLLANGLAFYERGNEGRALLREQVAYQTWDDFARQWRWYDILRRYLAISLAVGVDGHMRDFAGVYDVICEADSAWLASHGDSLAVKSGVPSERSAWDLTCRILKGTSSAGSAYRKDMVYLQGNINCWQVAGESAAVVSIGDLGKIDIANAAHLATLRAFAG